MAVIVGGCSTGKVPVSAAAIDPARLEAMVKVLASDAFEGRAPGTPGEDKTVAYLIEQFQAIGIQPGGRDGQWTQAVPMMRTFLESPQLAFTYPQGQLQLVQGENIEVSTVRAAEHIHAEEVPLVFVGFGVTAPERDWDDYGDIDLTGKIAVYLVNDPDFAAEPGEPVAGRFGNRRMTYYGRWAYKYEEAARRGALGALVIHETEAAGYDWSVAAAGAGERVALARNATGPAPIALQGWLHEGAATELLAMAGHDLATLRSAARQPDFSAFELDGVQFRVHSDVTVTRFDSRNVLGLLPGSARPDEVLMVSAHWDAYGEGPPDAQGRTVRAGANDDALGTAGVLEIARVLQAGPPLERSVVFALWTAEESGLVGSQAYAVDPIYPLETTVANFTLDILQTAGAARDVILVGEGQSSLEDDLARAAAAQGRYVTPENLPENGLFYRADHFSLARAGVPVLLLMGIAGGADLVEGGRAAGNQWIADYVGNCYHKPCDAWSPDWDLSGAVQDIELFRRMVEDLGNARRWPEWRPASEFKAVRDSSAAARGRVNRW
ncbi:MAG: peptidase M20 [Haliea sp.]|nr:peptidase M20 [Haliea sp.]